MSSRMAVAPEAIGEVVRTFQRLTAAPTRAAAQQIAFGALTDPGMDAGLALATDGRGRAVLNDVLTGEPGVASVAAIHDRAAEVLASMSPAALDL